MSDKTLYTISIVTCILLCGLSFYLNHWTTGNNLISGLLGLAAAGIAYVATKNYKSKK